MSKCKGKVCTLLIIGAPSAVVHLRHESRSLAWAAGRPVRDAGQLEPRRSHHSSTESLRDPPGHVRGRSRGFCRTVAQRTQPFDGDGQVIKGVGRSSLTGWSTGRVRRSRTRTPLPWNGDRPHLMVFITELPARYALTLLRLRPVRERPARVVGFQPKRGRLPVRHRMDHALKKSHGGIWIDRDAWEVARVSFQLMERVRWWWGIGRISDATEHIDRAVVREVATRFDLVARTRAAGAPVSPDGGPARR